jgi:hypothetical protein
MNINEHSLLKIRVRGMKHNEINNTYLQSMCDWYITEMFIGDENIQPRFIFIKVEYIAHFYKKYYPKINNSTKFVIITGMGDKTIPNQIDSRWPEDKNVKNIVVRLLQNNNLIGWFAENCDELLPKMYGIPTGVYETDPLKQFFNTQFNKSCTIDDKNITVLCCHRLREWTHERKKVNDLCETSWNTFTDYKINVNNQHFLDTLSNYTFTLCVNGGGLDPSPKAFESIIAGSIPIIKYSSGIYSAYKDLPVVFIKDWTEDEINYEKLQTWVYQYRKYYENLELRRETLYKLTFEYWKKHILNYYNDHI